MEIHDAKRLSDLNDKSKRGEPFSYREWLEWRELKRRNKKEAKIEEHKFSKWIAKIPSIPCYRGHS